MSQILGHAADKGLDQPTA